MPPRLLLLFRHTIAGADAAVRRYVDSADDAAMLMPPLRHADVAVRDVTPRRHYAAALSMMRYDFRHAERYMLIIFNHNHQHQQ